jgi:hypothetical protein
VGNRHELGECWPSKECIVCHFKIGYLKLHVLGEKVLSNPKRHGKSNLADGSRYHTEDYSMERSLTLTQCWSGKPHLVVGLQEQYVQGASPLVEDSVELDVLDDGANNQRIPTQFQDEVRAVALVKGHRDLKPL